MLPAGVRLIQRPPKPFMVSNDFPIVAQPPAKTRSFVVCFPPKEPHVYRIVYAVNKRNRIVNVLRIRHGARHVLSAEYL
jgi:hypothetical protein